MQEQHIPVYQVDTGVPIPSGQGLTGLLKSLEVGESFLIPLGKRKSVQTLASLLKKTENRRFTIKKMDENMCRVWRTE